MAGKPQTVLGVPGAPDRQSSRPCCRAGRTLRTLGAFPHGRTRGWGRAGRGSRRAGVSAAAGGAGAAGPTQDYCRSRSATWRSVGSTQAGPPLPPTPCPGRAGLAAVTAVTAGR